MPIENRNLSIGTKLMGKYHKQPYQCEVIEGEAGKLKYRLQDGREFKSPSAAGMAITGHACDGWTFWSEAKGEAAQVDATANVTQMEAAPVTAPEVKAEVAETEAATEIAEATPVADAAPEAPAKKTKGARKLIFRLPNQKGVPEGQVKWYCHNCGNFLVKTGETPTTCPNGHAS